MLVVKRGSGREYGEMLGLIGEEISGEDVISGDKEKVSLSRRRFVMVWREVRLDVRLLSDAIESEFVSVENMFVVRDFLSVGGGGRPSGGRKFSCPKGERRPMLRCGSGSGREVLTGISGSGREGWRGLGVRSRTFYFTSASLWFFSLSRMEAHRVL